MKNIKVTISCMHITSHSMSFNMGLEPLIWLHSWLMDFNPQMGQPGHGSVGFCAPELLHSSIKPQKEETVKEVKT